MDKLKEEKRCRSNGAITFNYDGFLQRLDSYGVKKQSRSDEIFVAKETKINPSSVGAKQKR